MDKHFYLKELRLKKLNVGYPSFKFPNYLIEVVSFDEFVKEEENRLPLFIGTQFGIYPKLVTIFKRNTKAKVVVILSKSLLSGHVSGLNVCLYANGKITYVIKLEI